MSDVDDVRESSLSSPSGTILSRLRYGVNEATGWRHFATGEHRERIRERLCAITTQIVRIYVFDRHTPDPVTDWPGFARYVQGVLDAGATPMITLSRFRPPFDDAATVRWFAQRCGDLAWNCIEQWGGDVVREWYWCVWSEPNSDWISPGLTFDRYRQIYLEAAVEILRWIGPYLGGRRALIGGPAIDTFQPFWLDWLWRFVHEIDNALIGFVLWHRFGDWRAPGEWRAPAEERLYRGLLMSRTAEYAEQAAAIQRLAGPRGMLNICGKLNASAHPEMRVGGPLNQSMFGAVYYAAALIQLMRGGADGELYWMGTDAVGPYGLWDGQGRPTQAFRAKELVAQAVRFGDEIIVDESALGRRELLVLRARDAGGRRSALIVHLADRPRSYEFAGLLPEADGYAALRRIAGGKDGQLATTSYKGVVEFDGLGVAMVMADVMAAG
jgi:hypothetical protein